MKKAYISEEERKSCQLVAEAYSELYEQSDILVLDAGRYGFVLLQDHHHDRGFLNVQTYTDHQFLFNGLWQAWLDMWLFKKGKEQGCEDINLDEVYEKLDADVKAGLAEKERCYRKKSGMVYAG